jgi:peroxiredoxin
LLDFQKNIKDFERRNVTVMAASADPWEKALETVERYKLSFRIGYGLSPRDVAASTGAFFNEKENYIHATGFIINPESRVENALYSSRSVGRLVAKDCLEFIGR